jgi:regulator of PEP synthase PpsR (kinase-PPPase family)
MKSHSVFCVSDHTGVTVEAVAKSVLAQFPSLEFSLTALPFIDSPEKAQAAATQIAATPDALVFSTLSDPALRAILHDSRANLFDIFGLVVPAVETALGQAATPSGGRTHGMANNYESRMDAVNFSLALDDGLQPQRLEEADLILVGVSRVGKTPTALYLALPRLRALTLSAERLAAIRHARYPDSRYASPQQCRAELAAAEKLFAHHALTVLDTTRMSVEEIAAHLRHP